MKSVTYQAIGITFFCMLLVCVVFIPNLWSVLWAALAIASTTVGKLLDSVVHHGRLGIWKPQ